MFVPNRELGDFLLDARLLTRSDLSHALENVGEEDSLYSLLMKNAAVPEDELIRAAAQVVGVPFASIDHEEISREALLLIPEPIARVYSLAAFKRGGGDLHVMLLDLDSLTHIQFLENELGVRLIPRLTDRASIKRALLLMQRELKDKYATRFKNPDAEVLLDALLSHALLSRAEEIHLMPGGLGQPTVGVRYRINQSMQNAMAINASASALTSKLKELANLSFTLPLPQEGKFKTVLKNGESVRVLVATLPTHAGEKITLHLSHGENTRRGFTLDSLGLHGETLEALHQALHNRSGLVLVGAPEGGGKTTTIYTLLDYLAAPERSIISVEEKIEMVLPHVAQTLVRRELGQTVASATRSALAHHPDMLAIGEIKDEETASLALSAASRGILVVAGISAESAEEAKEKMISLNISEKLLSSNLRASLGLQVVRRVCADCKEEYHLSRAEAAPLEAHANFGRVLAALKAEGIVEEGKQWKDILFARAAGCAKCDEGYVGQVGLEEIALGSGSEGEAPLNIIEDGLFKAAQGLTSIEEVRNLAI